MKKILIILTTTVLALSACAPSQPASTSGQDVSTIVAMTIEAITVPVPAITAQAIGLSVKFNNVSFNIPPELDANASPSTNTDVEFPYINPSNGPMPEHVVFKLSNYPAAGDAKIMVFKASDYAAYGQHAAVTALTAGQDSAQPLPDALLYGKIYSQPKPVQFQIGHGVRYLYEPDIAIAPITDQNLFYYYEGVTNDGAYFVSAVLHLHITFLVADGIKDSVTPPDGIPFNWGPDLDYAKYKTDVIQKLNDTPADNYTPSLTVLDKMISSLLVANQ
jgi:hypothetical protein